MQSYGIDGRQFKNQIERIEKSYLYFLIEMIKSTHSPQFNKLALCTKQDL